MIYETSSLACDGLHRWSHNWYTITSCTPSKWFPENVNAHWRGLTFNLTLTSFIRGHTSLLQIPTHPHLGCRWTVFLLTDIPIQDHAQQLGIYQVFNLVISHGNLSAHYAIDTKYLDITYNETKAVKIWEKQFITCQQPNRQFCSINTPLQPLANPPTCIAAINAKNKAGIEKRCSLQIRNINSATIPTPIAPNVWILTSPPTVVSTGIALICPDEAPRFIETQMPIHILHLPQACSTTSQHFNLPPWYETHQITVNISLNTANLNVMRISSPDFRIWQHLEDHWNGTQLHHLVNIPSVPIDEIYKHMINSNRPIIPFISTEESVDDTASLWTLFSHTGIYVMAIESIIPVGFRISCCYLFWCQPARLAHWPLQSGSLWHTIVDDDVDAAPIYKCDGKAGQHIIRPHENHNLCMKWEPTWMESQQKQQAQSKAVPTSRSLDIKSKIQGMWWAHMVCCQT